MPILTVTRCNIDEILSSAIREGARVNITRKTQNGWQLLKSKFQGISLDGIEIAPPITTYGEDQELCGNIGISFRKGHQKLIFKTQCSKNTLTRPIRMIQVGRVLYKKQIPNQSETVRFWKEEQTTRNIHYGELVDISGGGLSVKTPQPHPPGQYICAVDVEPNIAILSLLKRCEPENNRHLLSFQFLGIDFDPEEQLRRIHKICRKFQKSSRYR